MRSIIVAYDRNRVIGSENALPWAGQLPNDLEHFKQLTQDKAVIMGRKTFESLPERFRPLPNRQNIVISLSQKAIQGVQVAASLEDAYSQAESEPFIIGGEQIYRLALPTVDTIHATEIETDVIGGDAFFPALNPAEWYSDNPEHFAAEGKNRYDHSFVTYHRRTPLDN